MAFILILYDVLLLAFFSSHGSNPIKVAVDPITMVKVTVVNSEK